MAMSVVPSWFMSSTCADLYMSKRIRLHSSQYWVYNYWWRRIMLSSTCKQKHMKSYHWFVLRNQCWITKNVLKIIIEISIRKHVCFGSHIVSGDSFQLIDALTWGLEVEQLLSETFQRVCAFGKAGTEAKQQYQNYYLHFHLHYNILFNDRS